MVKLRTSRSDGVATLVLDRPGLGNALDLTLVSHLVSATREIASDDRIRCVVLTGSDPVFCVGGDVGAFADAGDGAGQFLDQFAASLHAAVMNLVTMPKPLITRVNGPAAGSGLSLALLGDVVIASEAAHFSVSNPAAGLTPIGGLSWLLPRLVGLRRAQEMMLVNRRIGAREAQAIGLVTRCVSEAALDEDVAATAAAMATSAVRALGQSRSLLLGGSAVSLRDHLAAEVTTIVDAVAMSEAREGIDAFLGRRNPDFLKAMSRERSSVVPLFGSERRGKGA